MWTRAELKEKAKAMMKHSYWMMFSVSLVAYLLTDAFADILDMLSEQHLLPLRGGLNLTVNGRSIWLNIPWLQMLQLQNALFFALIAIMLMVFIGNVIKVGTNRYYLGAASGPQPFSTLFSAFSSHYLNVVKVMFLVSVKILAWSLLLVIPGIVKSVYPGRNQVPLPHDPVSARAAAGHARRRRIRAQPEDDHGTQDGDVRAQPVVSGMAHPGHAGFPYRCMVCPSLH